MENVRNGIERRTGEETCELSIASVFTNTRGVAWASCLNTSESLGSGTLYPREFSGYCGLRSWILYPAQGKGDYGRTRTEDHIRADQSITEIILSTRTKRVS